jgi:1,4-dihydroxy-2-naphthoate octaprenyltransferase
MLKINVLARVSRLNFIPASLLPYFLGAALVYYQGLGVPLIQFGLGIIIISFAHFAGNLFNEYYDSLSGADIIHNFRSPFFGGTKSIKEGVIKPSAVLLLAIGSLLIVFITSILTVIYTGKLIFLLIFFIVGFLLIQYTAGPFRFAYNRMGELNIFLLFGVGLVVGSYYLLTGKVNYLVLLNSLPIAFLILSVIICNEVPDADFDIQAGKHNLVNLVGKEKGYFLYSASVILSAFTLMVCVALNTLPGIALFALLFYPIGVVSAYLLKNRFNEPEKLNIASRNTIILHMLVGTFLIFVLLII